MPQISVIVPVYKVEPYLHRCVDSILGQTFSDFDLILVDDGSPDNCGAICDEYAAKDSRVHVIHQQNGGLSAARNAGIDWVIDHSDSRWLAFVDSDDVVAPDYLSRMFTAAVSQEADLCICDFQTILADGRIANDDLRVPDLVANGQEILNDSLIYSNWHLVIAWNKLYDKHLFYDLRFPVGYIHEDEAVIHRILGTAKKVCCIPDRLYNYMIRGDSITGGAKTIRSTDYLSALADRIRFAKQNQMTEMLAQSVRTYHSELLYTAMPLIIHADPKDCHIKRTARATRSVLLTLLRCTYINKRNKVRIALFSLLPKLYLLVSRFREKK